MCSEVFYVSRDTSMYLGIISYPHASIIIATIYLTCPPTQYRKP